MRILVYSAKRYDRESLGPAFADSGHELEYTDARLEDHSAALAAGFDAVCLFVADHANAAAIERLARGGVRLIVLRCAGFNNVDMAAADAAGIPVVRVPAYSPYAVAEHAVALMLTLNRKTHRAWSRTREGNFALDGLLGFDMHGRTVGIIGTGSIGKALTSIMCGMGCRVLVSDPYPDEEFARRLPVTYVDRDELLEQSDIISLHCPLVPETWHLIDAEAISRMKRGAMLINTSRGGVVDAQALIAGIKSGQLGSVGLDVYEEEDEVFFEDASFRVLDDDVLARLMTFPNVIVTGHQAFFTADALHAIAQTTRRNVDGFAAGHLPERNIVHVPASAAS